MPLPNRTTRGDFYLDRVEGFLLYADLDKSTEELEALDKEFISTAIAIA